jgi:lysine 2,3-aminomutase
MSGISLRTSKPRRGKECSERPISAKSEAFRKEFFPDATPAEWKDWRWQIRNRITTFERLSAIVKLSPDEAQAGCRGNNTCSLSITPYYASLLDKNDPLQPIRRTVIPVQQEYLHAPCESEDPLSEDDVSPVPGIVHRYPDRVLFLTTGFCCVRCRYCTRSRLVDQNRDSRFSFKDWKLALAYVESNPSIRDVLLSGGDPLTLPDEVLDWLLSRLFHIPHVNFLRIGTKVPAVLPQRISGSLIRILKQYHPLWMSVHFTHPDELTSEVKTACNRLADAGIPLGSQTVLLKGVNDDAEVMKKLFHGLLTLRVRPYYLYQCDPILGSSHFRTPVNKGVEIVERLRGHTSGYAVPTFVIDAPGGGGKLPLQPAYVIGREGDSVVLRNYKGVQYRYPDTSE